MARSWRRSKGLPTGLLFPPKEPKSSHGKSGCCQFRGGFAAPARQVRAGDKTRQNKKQANSITSQPGGPRSFALRLEVQRREQGWIPHLSGKTFALTSPSAEYQKSFLKDPARRRAGLARARPRAGRAAGARPPAPAPFAFPTGKLVSGTPRRVARRGAGWPATPQKRRRGEGADSPCFGRTPS